MKKIQIFGFLLLLVSTVSMLQGSSYALETNDNDNDGVPNNLDQCPFLQEDYNPEYGNNIDGCPADFVPWYDADYDGIEDHVDETLTVVLMFLHLKVKELLIQMVMVLSTF
jgi:hypothetical protein